MKELAFELGKFIPANQGERSLGNPDAQPRQTVNSVFEAEKDKSALCAIRDELRNNSLLMVILSVAVDAQPPNYMEVANSNQGSQKHELTIEEAIVMILRSFIELTVGIFKAIDNKAKAYFLNQKGIFDGPGKKLLEKSLAQRPNFHFLRPDIRSRSNCNPPDDATRAGARPAISKSIVSRPARSICLVEDAFSATAKFL